MMAEIDEELTFKKCYFFAARLTDEVKCSHTGVRLPSGYQSSMNRFGNFFPLKLFFTGGRAYNIPEGCHLYPQIPSGTEIVSINGLSTDDIITKLFYFIPSEGNNKTTEYNETE